jgi:hypothetical protein
MTRKRVLQSLLPLLPLLVAGFVSSCSSRHDSSSTTTDKALLTMTMDAASCGSSSTVVAIDEVASASSGYSFNGITLAPGRSFELALAAETYQIHFTGYDARGMRTVQWSFEVTLVDAQERTETLSCTTSRSGRIETPTGGVNFPVELLPANR